MSKTLGYIHRHINALRQKCVSPIRTPLGVSPCGDPAVKAHRCGAHYTDWRNARESRRGTEAVNAARRAKKALGLSGRQFVRHRKAASRAARAVA